jgi:hypothetical protein
MLRLVYVATLALVLFQQSDLQAVDFSAQAEALPFPRDAREVEFDATFDGIEYTSGSSLAALVDYYRKEMPKRGWTEDKSAAEIEDDSAELTFEHEADSVDIEFAEYSDGVTVSMDSEGLDFSHTSDPAALIKAGVPQPPAYVFLQQELPRPADVQDEEYSDDASHFKSTLALQAAFDFYAKALKGASWRETRQPIITSDRRYTEYARGADEVSVNVFTDPVGSRIILDYETKTKEPVVPPLDEPLAGLATTGTTGTAAPQAPARTAVEVAKNTGSATVTLEGKKYTFKHAAAYRTKRDGENNTQLFFADRPIPLARLQELLSQQDNVSVSDIYGDSSWPGHLSIDVGQYTSFSFNSGGIGVGNSIDDPVKDLKFDNGRVVGSIKTPKPIEVFDDEMSLEATIDAGLMTPNTQIGTSRTK